MLDNILPNIRLGRQLLRGWGGIGCDLYDICGSLPLQVPGFMVASSRLTVQRFAIGGAHERSIACEFFMQLFRTDDKNPLTPKHTKKLLRYKGNFGRMNY